MEIVPRSGRPEHIFKMAETPQQPLPKRHDFQTSADLERVTDYAEEKEISTTDLENVSVIFSCLGLLKIFKFTCFLHVLMDLTETAVNNDVFDLSLRTLGESYSILFSLQVLHFIFVGHQLSGG